jgi:hypothetical protein
MLYREITAVCSQTYKKVTNTVCGQNRAPWPFVISRPDRRGKSSSWGMTLVVSQSRPERGNAETERGTGHVLGIWEQKALC